MLTITMIIMRGCFILTPCSKGWRKPWLPSGPQSSPFSVLLKCHTVWVCGCVCVCWLGDGGHKPGNTWARILWLTCSCLCPFLLSPTPQAVQRRACASPHSAEAPQRSQRTLLRVISLHPAVTVGGTRSYSGSLARARRPGAGAARVSQHER